MDPLSIFVVQVLTEFAKKVGTGSYELGKKLFDILVSQWKQEPKSRAYLDDFLKEPDIYALPLTKAVNDALANSPQLKNQITNLVAENTKNIGSVSMNIEATAENQSNQNFYSIQGDSNQINVYKGDILRENSRKINSDKYIEINVKED